MSLQSYMHVRTNAAGVVSRRSFLQVAAAGAATGLLGWREALAQNADALRRENKACILLFMRGGPSQFETFDPKPGHDNGGPTTAIPTAVSGIRIAEPWEKVARQMNDIALIRSMNSREGEHARAVYQMHTGYIPAGGVRFPSFGAVAASQIAPRDFDLPHFVSIGNRFAGIGAGFLSTAYSPFVVADPNQLPNNTQLPGSVTTSRFGRRMELMNDLEADYAQTGGARLVDSHRHLYEGASNMVRSPRLQAFDLSREANAVRDRYGRTSFGQGCLLARRLVESGVTFVEVDLNGWDTHQNNFETCQRLSAQADAGFAALVNDLRERGRLDRTLVIWMGEFGRTPRINANTGRDHYPRAFSVALAGGGIHGGRVIGATNAGGNDVLDRPVGVADLFCTFCQSLSIDPRKENVSPNGRPVKIVDGGRAVRELF